MTLVPPGVTGRGIITPPLIAVIPAIIVPITAPPAGDASSIGTSKLCPRATRGWAASLITAIAAVVVVVTLPGRQDAATIGAREATIRAQCLLAASFITHVSTVI